MLTPMGSSPGVTHVAAGRIAQPPKAAFVARLRPSRSPSQAARQLPDPSTLIRVEPPSTRETRRQGAHGDMSIVGPRPHASAHDRYFTSAIEKYAFRHHVKSGITGWAQVSGARITPKRYAVEFSGGGTGGACLPQAGGTGRAESAALPLRSRCAAAIHWAGRGVVAMKESIRQARH